MKSAAHSATHLFCWDFLTAMIINNLQATKAPESSGSYTHTAIGDKTVAIYLYRPLSINKQCAILLPFVNWCENDHLYRMHSQDQGQPR
jgi:hypothetical protein